jgi:hypothetical protein
MIKWVGPFWIIFIAFLVVAVITYGVVESGAPSGIVQVLVRPNAEAPGEREGWNRYAIDQLLRPLIVIASIVVVVAPVIAWFKKRRMLRYYSTNRL